MKKSKILTILMVLVLMFSLVACSTAKNNDKSQSNNTADISDLMESEPSNLDDATALYQKLMQKENEILSSNSQLWEKVFMSANKDTSMIKDGTNYGDFLLNTIENGKDKFTADELKILKDGANQIKKIEDKLTTLEQKYPGCGSKPSEGESVDAESAGMVSDKSKLTKFPSFKGKDLDGNDVNSDDIFSSNNVTVINFWFTTCNPCVGELGDLEKLNKELAEKGDVTTQFVSYAESGKRAMRPENLLKISSALEVSADYLLTGEIIDKDLLILSDKLRRLTPSQVRTVEAIIDECNNLFNQKEITLLSQKRNGSY